MNLSKREKARTLQNSHANISQQVVILSDFYSAYENKYHVIKMSSVRLFLAGTVLRTCRNFRQSAELSLYISASEADIKKMIKEILDKLSEIL